MTTANATVAYPNRKAAIEAEILPLLGDNAENYDINALADKTLDWVPDGYGICYFLDRGVDFWATTDECEL